MNGLLALAIYLLVAVILWWGLTKVLAAFSVPAPISTLVTVIFVVVVALTILGSLTGHVSVPHIRF